MSAAPFPGFEHLYLWSNQDLRPRAFVAGEDYPQRVRSIAIGTGRLRLDAPLQARWRLGAEAPSDVVAAPYGSPHLVRERVVQTLAACGATGWGTYPATLYGQNGAPIEGFVGLTVTGRCGPVMLERARQISAARDGTLAEAFEGVSFDPASWDGTDVFTDAATATFPFVTDRVKRALDEAGCAPGTLVPLAQARLWRARR